MKLRAWPRAEKSRFRINGARDRLPAHDYSLLVLLLRLLRAPRRGDAFSPPSVDAADFRGRRGLASEEPRFLALRAGGSVSRIASSPIGGTSLTVTDATGSGVGRVCSTTPIESR